MSDPFFSPQYIYKKKKWILANQIHDGAWPMLCTVYYYLTWVTLCNCVKWDAKTRLQSQSESHVLQSAFSCQAHLDCFTCACDPVVQCSSVCVELLAKSKKSGV